MAIIDPSDTGESYATLALFQPKTAYKALFSDALDRATRKVEQLVPKFGLRNPRMGAAGSYSYEYCTEDEWVASFWPGQIWLAYSMPSGVVQHALKILAPPPGGIF